MVRIILKFGVVGVINTIIDYVLFQIFIAVFDIRAAVFIFLASCVSSGIAMINSFILNKKWTFEDKEEKYIKQFITFFIINIFSIVLNSGTVTILNGIVSQDFHMLGLTLRSLLFTKVVAIAFTMVFNFICYRIWVFKPVPAQAT